MFQILDTVLVSRYTNITHLRFVVNHILENDQNILSRGQPHGMMSGQDETKGNLMSEEVKRNPDRHAEKRWAVQLPAKYKGPLMELATERGMAVTELITKTLESYLNKCGKEAGQ